MGGIKPDPEMPGFKNILLKPYFVEGLDNFSAEHDGPYGKIMSSWKKEENKIIYSIVVPPSSTATVWLHGKNVLLEGKTIEDSDHAELVYQDDQEYKVQLESGSYAFVVE